MTTPLRAGVLFDVDGTLADTNYLHTLAWARAFRQSGEWAPMNAIHRLVGMGGDNLIPELLGHDSPPAAEARTACYRDLIDEARVFPGARDLVAAVHDRGLATVLATSSPSDELDILLERLEIDEFLDAKTTADDIERSKPSPEVFLTAMKNASLDPARTLAIGDSIWDVEAARDAGIGCIGVESGGFSRHELSEAGALHVYRDAKEILDQLLTTPLATLSGSG
ncbi:MAG TPA: HAD family hydrolase [Acidimicrobiales bacterium]|jgi:HAD superfamily hydrolase (TIGR01509 family)|nr:HAD family hydrolase [Acidimicrobiales bacterium]